MKEYNYTAILQNGRKKLRITRAFTKQLTDEMIAMLDRDLTNTYPEYKIVKYELEVRDVK